jgi:hypothetical protein
MAEAFGRAMSTRKGTGPAAEAVGKFVLVVPGQPPVNPYVPADPHEGILEPVEVEVLLEFIGQFY